MPEETCTERPELSLEKVAMCLHYLEECPTAPLKSAGYPHCPVMRSMELDLLSYRFQLDPPFGSQCESHGRVPVELVFPEHIAYQSEGRQVTLACPTPRKPADLIISSTHFLRSGLKIWHVVIAPRPGHPFTEFDLIKLIQLYDGRTEATHLEEVVRFQFGDGTQALASHLLRAAYPAASGRVDLRAGTLQIASEEQEWSGRTLAELLAAVHAPPVAGGEPSGLDGWLDESQPEARALTACCGVVSGIFDFSAVDADEVRDILEPTVADADGLLRIHRCTLASLSGDDRAMDACRDSVGISPYLIIPHAVLLHNEAMVDAADRDLEKALAERRAGLRRLEEAHERADLLLNRFYLPNVFNYRSERTLFLRGADERGSEERRTAALGKLAELDSRISRKWEARRDTGQMCIAVLLAWISVLQLKEIVFVMVGSRAGEVAGWAVLGAAAAALALLMVFLWRQGVRR